ncbi:MAG: hypothetical protein VR68_08500 [Peptococcaceae bacterium BRH_c4a]|nr:MAG: hypothetical protein VR68_08500 [Peptococcaceae bacterium BRH_c4a]
MRYLRFVAVTVILLLALFPLALYAETSHDGHGGGAAPSSHASAPATGQNMNDPSGSGHDRHGPAAVSEKSSAGEHQSAGRGGESGPNVLQPVKNGIVTGFTIFNGLIIIAAIIMKKKLGQGV